jgi:hypothetical protein
MNRAVWNTGCALKLKMAHKILAYLILLSGFGAVAFGIYFYRINPKHASDVPLEWIQMGIFGSVLLICELVY